jgi:hypothetical protein
VIWWVANRYRRRNCTRVNTGSAGAFGVTNLAQTWSAVQTINLNAAALPAAVGGTSFRIGGANATTNRLTMDAFGAVSSLLFQRADGTAASPTAVQSQEALGSILAFGYGATGYSSGSRANMQFFADQNWTDTAQGAGVTFNTTLNGGTTALERFRIANDGGITVHDVSGAAPTGGSKGPGTINVTGGFYINNVAVGAGSTTGFGVDGGTNPQTISNPAAGAATIANNAEQVNIASLNAATTLTLPAISAIPSPTTGCIRIHDKGQVGATNTLTVKGGVSDGINNGAANGTIGPFTTPNLFILACVSGANNWNVGPGTIAPSSASSTQIVSGVDANGLTYATVVAAVKTFWATPSSANLAAALTDETGTGAAVFAGSPALTGTPTAPTASVGTNTTQLATTAFVLANAGGGGSGALTLVSTQTANNTATSVSWTGLTGKDYRLKCRNLVPATNAATLSLQFGEGGTPTWETASYGYAYHYVSLEDSAVTGNGNKTPAGGVTGILINNGNDNTAGIGASFTAELSSLSDAVTHQVLFDAIEINSGVYYQFKGSGVYTGDANAITAVRIITSAGNLSTGSCSLYALSN